MTAVRPRAVRVRGFLAASALSGVGEGSRFTEGFGLCGVTHGSRDGAELGESRLDGTDLIWRVRAHIMRAHKRS